ncbi:unnamed protein product, partial [Rotaria sp. Silwood2]
HIDQLKIHIETISIHSQSHLFEDINQLIRLTHSYLSNQIWIRTMSLLKLSTTEQLRNCLILLSDDLARQCGFISSNSLLINVPLAYGRFRCDLLIEQSKCEMISDYSNVAYLTNKIRDWMTEAHLNVFNLLENIKKISDNINCAQNQMKNFTGDTSCSILPIEIRPEDLICLFAPEYTTIIEAICEKVNEIDEFLSCRRDKIESIKLSLTKPSSEKRATHGLSSYVYLNQSSTSVFLFDKHKHIHYILDDTISFIQQLINSYVDINYRNCFLMKIATSYKELFPIHIALSLALIILIGWSSYYL